MSNIVPRMTTQAKNIAFLYHDQDQQWKEDLCNHFVMMRRQGLVSIVERTSPETMPFLDIIIILISPKLYASDKALNAIDYALAHRQADQRIFGVLIQDVEDLGSLDKVTNLPRNGVPLSKWKHKSEGLALIAGEVRKIAKGEG